MGDAGDAQVVLLAAGRPDADRVTGRHVDEAERGALEGNLPVPRREPAVLGGDEVDALVGEVRQRREEHLALRAVVAQEPDDDAPPALGLVHARHALDDVHELPVEPEAGEDRGGRGPGCGEALLEVAPEQGVRSGHRADGEGPDRDRRDDERGACAVLAQVPADLAPAHAPEDHSGVRRRLSSAGIEYRSMALPSFAPIPYSRAISSFVGPPGADISGANCLNSGIMAMAHRASTRAM